MAPPPIPWALTFSGRTFAVEELHLIQQITAECGSLGRTALARTLCELLAWTRPSGRLKHHEGRLLLERLQALGWLTLPPVRALGRRGPRVAPVTAQGEPAPALVGSVGQFAPLVLEVVEAGPDGTSRLWTELIARYHYVGYRVPVGATLRYLVHSAHCREQVLACLLWSSPAWALAVRDRWIGWSDAQRRQNLLRSRLQAFRWFPSFPLPYPRGPSCRHRHPLRRFMRKGLLKFPEKASDFSGNPGALRDLWFGVSPFAAEGSGRS